MEVGGCCRGGCGEGLRCAGRMMLLHQHGGVEVVHRRRGWKRCGSAGVGVGGGGWKATSSPMRWSPPPNVFGYVKVD